MATATLYSVRDWSKHFENNRTRELKKLDWVPIPNKQDGDGYTELLAEDDGAALFGAWIIMVQIASKCSPRGSLVREDGTPHTSQSLARMSRAPAGLLARAFLVLVRVGWLQSIPYEIPHLHAVIPHPSEIALTGREGKGRESTEGKGREGNDAHPPDAHIPTIEEVIERGSMIGTPESSCRKFFNHHQGQNLWINQFGRLIDWPHKLKTWGENDRSRGPVKGSGHLDAAGAPLPGYLANGLRYDLPD